MNAATPNANPAALFTETALIRKKKQRELLAKGIFGSMALAMIIPLFIIIAYLVARAWQLLSWNFLTHNPTDGMRKGGIWSAFLGTIYLVVVSLCVAAPLGMFSAVYLNEYAKENWFTRIVNLAVVNLAGMPSIVHRSEERR